MTAAITRDAMPARILDYLATKLPDAKALRLERLERIAVGWSHETWLFDLCYDQDGAACRDGLCLRRDPGNALLRHLSDLKEQFRVLQCLEATPPPTPRPYWFEDDPGILGAPFLVMEKVPGECPSPWGREGRKYYAEAADRGVLPASFTDTLATLHTLDWRAAGLEFLGVPEGGTSFALAEVAKWRELIAVRDRPPEPILTDLIVWLEENAPTTDRVCLVHGTYRSGNLLIDNDHVSALLDWELQVLGDPMYDVAYVLSDLNREGYGAALEPRASGRVSQRVRAGDGVGHRRPRMPVLRGALRNAVGGVLDECGGVVRGRASDDLRLARTAWSVPVVLRGRGRCWGIEGGVSANLLATCSGSRPSLVSSVYAGGTGVPSHDLEYLVRQIEVPASRRFLHARC